MKFIADFHIHSHYSRATSKLLTPEHLDYWAQVKGIKVVGTGDFTHPGWLAELKEKLEPAEPGLFRLKKELKKQSFPGADSEVRFLLTAEISNIYKKNEKVRKIHHVVFAPDFETAKKIQQKLVALDFNITSDGRPILGMDSRDLLELCLDASPDIFFVPAHIWTPWFAVLGSKSGFDSIQECFGDLTSYIHAVETGLSSDPPLNWMCSRLDKFTLLSNSDAHSPDKLGRNANFFDTDLSYPAIIQAIKKADKQQFLGTIDMFPQEGKYHFDGHRKCNVCWDPVQTLRNNGTCPVCGKKVTVGVTNRIARLTDREDLSQKPNRLPFYSIIPLPEIIAEIAGVGAKSKKVQKQYMQLVEKAGSEFNILLHHSIKQVREISNDLVAEAIRRMRAHQVHIKHGFDGEYGQIKVFGRGEMKEFTAQESLFAPQKTEKRDTTRQLLEFDLKEYRRLQNMQPADRQETLELENLAKTRDVLAGLNAEQKAAVQHTDKPALIVAGPGTGKTRVLTFRIAYLINEKNIEPENILAITFTNKASLEIKERLTTLLNDKNISDKIAVTTFHAFGLSVLKKYHKESRREEQFNLIDEEDKLFVLTQKLGVKKKSTAKISRQISAAKQALQSSKEIEDNELARIFNRYEIILNQENLFDLDDLIYQTIRLFQQYPAILSEYRQQLPWIMVDEYQDVNYAQYQLIRLLAPSTSSNLCVIGDPNQAIYGFRGADVKYIRQFGKDYPDAAIYQLKMSYRCSTNILQASEDILHKAGEEQNMLEGLNQGVKINIAPNRSGKSEAEFIARSIERMMGGLRMFSMDSNISDGTTDAGIESLAQFVVLTRTRSQFADIQEAFKNHSIPYQLVGETPFFQQEPVRSVIDVLKYAFSPQKEYLSSKLLDKKIIQKNELEKVPELIKGKTLHLLIQQIIEAYFVTQKEKNAVTFNKLLDISKEYGDKIDEFLKFTVLGKGIDTFKPTIENVALMTLHASKGLEFDCVFIAGCEEGLLPYNLYKSCKSDINEERRLLYVGMTRARKYLFLSHAERRMVNGTEHELKRSPFLNRIEKQLIETHRSEYKKKDKKDDGQLSLFS